MAYLLTGDIGGTKTLLQLSTTAEVRTSVLQKAYASAAYGGLEDMVETFLAEADIHDIDAACFALAGPVNGRVVKLTNLPWVVDGDALAARFNIKHVALINDFEAVGYGITALQPADLLTVQIGEAQPEGDRLVVGAGTGLGVAWLTSQQGSYRIHPSEAGHMDFAPVNEMQNLLMRYMQQRHEHVSYERIVSGPGLLAIFEFMRDNGIAFPSPQLVAAMKVEDAAAVLTRFSQQKDEEIAFMTVELFLSIYGAFVGNLALGILPRGGIYVAGGIAAKIATQLKASEFIHAYLHKGRFAGLLSRFPVHIVLNQNVGLLGASLHAHQNA
jgi:glucokinase